MIEYFLGTQRFAINSLFPDYQYLVMADLETTPITIIFEGEGTNTTGIVTTRPATAEETIQIQNMLEEA